MAVSLPTFPPFDVHSDASSTVVCWKKWLRWFENMMIGLNIKDDLKRKRALLLHYAGEEINDIFETLPDTGEENNYQAAIDALTAHFAGKILIQHFQVKCSWNKIYILSRTVSPLTIARASTILFLIELFPSSITKCWNSVRGVCLVCWESFVFCHGFGNVSSFFWFITQHHSLWRF